MANGWKKERNTVLNADMMFTASMKKIAERGEMMNCPRCGSWIDAGEPFCPECGYDGSDDDEEEDDFY